MLLLWRTLGAHQLTLVFWMLDIMREWYFHHRAYRPIAVFKLCDLHEMVKKVTFTDAIQSRCFCTHNSVLCIILAFIKWPPYLTQFCEAHDGLFCMESGSILVQFYVKIWEICVKPIFILYPGDCVCQNLPLCPIYIGHIYNFHLPVAP